MDIRYADCVRVCRHPLLVSYGARRHNFHYFNKDVMLSAMELLMDEQARSLDKTAIACGLLALAMGLFIVLSRSESSPAVGAPTANVGSASLREWHSFLADLPWSFKLAQRQRRAATCLLPRRFGSARRFICCRWPSLCRWGQSELGRLRSGQARIQQLDSVPAGLAQRTDRPYRFWAGAILIWIILIVMAVVGAHSCAAPKNNYQFASSLIIKRCPLFYSNRTVDFICVI